MPLFIHSKTTKKKKNTIAFFMCPIFERTCVVHEQREHEQSDETKTEMKSRTQLHTLYGWNMLCE